MGPPLPQRLLGVTATLGALSILTTVLRCYVRLVIIKKWGYDDSFMIAAFITHMWYTTTILTGIHYGTGRRTPDISLTDSLHAMRCWWLCFLAYSSTITLAKLSLGAFFLRLTSSIPLYRVIILINTIAAVIVGITYFFLTLFQCNPVSHFWTKLRGAQGTCLSIDVIVYATYSYGAVSAATDLTFSGLLALLIWNLHVEPRSKMLIAPLLGLACVASYAALIRMPYVAEFWSPDFLYGTVEISLWSTVEVGISVVAPNLATLRPLGRGMMKYWRKWSGKGKKEGEVEGTSEVVESESREKKDEEKLRADSCVVEWYERIERSGGDGESVVSSTRLVKPLEA